MLSTITDAHAKNQKINWYRTPVDRDLLAKLNQRSDAQGLVQVLGHFSIIFCTGALAWYAASHGSWLMLALALFLHGTVYAFLLNGFHELCHSTVFKSKMLNAFFLNTVSFLGGYNPVLFWASHLEHHKYTLHPPDDLEVVLPVEITLKSFLKYAFVNPWGFIERIKNEIRLSRGILKGEWENVLFPATEPHKRQRLFNWARLLLVGHAAIAAVSFALGLWMIPVLITLAPFYASCLLFLCNNTQHVGLQDNAPDFRLCTRTFLLNPIVRFLYWNMNYHIEHHMYAGVPCYRLRQLHQAIKHDLPHCPNGLWETWRGIISILRRQKVEPKYEFVPALPTSVRSSAA